jgi:hypothetical protein
MAIKNSMGKRIRLGIQNLQAGDVEEGLLHASIAVDKTSIREKNERKSSGKTFKNFLHKNHIILYGVSGVLCKSLRLAYTHPDVPGPIADMVDILYHACRCSMAHAGDLPANIVVNSAGTPFGPESSTRPLKLGSIIVYGLLLTAIASPVNRNEIFDVPIDFELSLTAFRREFRWRLGSLWGKRAYLEQILKDARAILDVPTVS